MKRRNFIFDIFSIGLMSSITSRLKANNFNISPMVDLYQLGKQQKQTLKLVQC